LAERDAVHRFVQKVTAMLAPSGADESGFAQLHEDLVEETLGQVFAGHNFLGAEHGAAEFGGDPEVDQRAEGVFSSLGHFHG
jgi:hypothetical protein